MFELLKCPHCGEAYTAVEVLRNVNNKLFRCKSCGKRIKRKRNVVGLMILLLVELILIVGIYIFINCLFDGNYTIIYGLVVVVMAFINYFLTSFFCRYEKPDDYK